MLALASKIPFLDVLDNFDIRNNGEVTYYRCKRCGFRVISESDALNHYHICLANPDWRKKYGSKEKAKESLDFWGGEDAE